MRPLKQTEALSAEQAHPPGCSAVSKTKPCSHKETFHPITAHSHGQGLHLPRFWTDLVVPHLRNPTCPSQHLHPELNTAAGLIQHHSRALALRNLQWRAAKGKISWKIPCSPLYSCLSGPGTHIFNWWIVWQQLWAEQQEVDEHCACSWLTTTLSDVAQYSPRTQPSHWTGYNSRESTREWRERGWGELCTSRNKWPAGSDVHWSRHPLLRQRKTVAKLGGKCKKPS